MYRLLIVDDEPAIVDGLMQHFQETDEFELDLCKAYSAFDALELVKKTKIDVVLSDIRMPGKTGLQLMDEILFYWPACRIIFLTGYSEFDYVYTAIQKNVDNYILKTEGLDTILAAIKQAIQRIDEESRNRTIVERAEKQMMLISPLMKKELFEALLSGETTSDIFTNGRFAEVGLNLQADQPVFMLMGKVDNWAEEDSYTNKLDVLYSIKDMLTSQLPSLFRIEDIVHDHSILVWFIQLDPNTDRFKGGNGQTEWREIINYLKGILESVQNNSQDLLGVSLSFALSKEAFEWDFMHKEFERLKNVLKRAMVLGQKMSIIDTGTSDSLLSMEADNGSLGMDEFPKLLGLLEKYMDEGDDNHVVTSISAIIQNIKHSLASNYLSGLERYYTFMLALLSHVNNLNMPDMLKDDNDFANLIIMEHPMEWESAETQLIELGEHICRIKKEQHEKGENLLIERIHRFIQENLGGDLSLARIAEWVYFNPSYLSRFYKQATGRNLSEYINTAKAEAAAGLLESMQLKINEIALSLGFESPSYFTAFFKKMMGRTPQEYRENYIQKTRK
ncbi:response regulator [Paenibacillus alkaliterrae]|uniref:response regulator transcription factor n=1 Tax=Paenibacillus alkaliterrae TaxID=320909 RepID=UPI001F2E782D|nr:response regulator [Paenibacillus alkaliterrae]MCF2937976.1 response regulator [Paenibacillus alkaliterrae]